MFARTDTRRGVRQGTSYGDSRKRRRTQKVFGRTWEVSAFAKNAMEDDTLRSFSDDFVSSGFNDPTAPAASPRPYFPQIVTYNSYSIVPEREIGITLRYNFGQ